MECRRPRRDAAAARPVVGRFVRAQANFFETFPIVIAAAVLGITGQHSRWTEIGADLARRAIVYLPLYATGVPVVRTIVFLISVY
jgi:uncharacterized MAPEG superfamily protein